MPPKTRGQVAQQAAQGVPPSPPVALPSTTVRGTRSQAVINLPTTNATATNQSAPSRSAAPRAKRVGGRGPTPAAGAPRPVNKPKRGRRKATPEINVDFGTAPNTESATESASAHEQDGDSDEGIHEQKQPREPAARSANRKMPFTFSTPMVPINGQSSVDGHLRSPVPRDGHLLLRPRKPSNAVTSDSLGSPSGPSSTLHFLVTSQDGNRAEAINIPTAQIDLLLAMLTTRYGTIENAPKLTLDTGQHGASLKGALKDKTHAQDRHELLNGHHERRASKQGRSQHYRPVQPHYDEHGNSTFPTDSSGRDLVPILGEEDESDLDTEIDHASSSFKENMPMEPEKESRRPVENEECALALRDTSLTDEALPDAPIARVPATPSRGVFGNLGNLVNTATRYIPGFRRAATHTPLANGPRIDALATPTQPPPLTDHLPPQTEPHHPTQPQTPSSVPKASANRAASVHVYHVKGQARTKEDIERLNVRRRQEKSNKRKDFGNLEAEAAKLKAERASLKEEKRQMEKAKEVWMKYTKQNPLPDDVATRELGSDPATKQMSARREKARTGMDVNDVVQQQLFGPPREPNAVGSRIAEAQSATKRKRRKSSPETIPNPAGGGYGINEEDFYGYGSDGDDDDTTYTASHKHKAPRLDDAADLSLPVGDPHKARPATGAYVHDEADEPQLHGGNVFRDVDVHLENMARAGKARDAALMMPPTTPSGQRITNMSGHFQVPMGSDSESDSDLQEDSTPAPKRSVKESLEEMSMFRGDHSRSSRESPQKPATTPGTSDSIPPLPRAPVPAHATLPAKSKTPTSKAPPSFKTGPRTQKYLDAALSKSANSRLQSGSEAPAEESDSLKAARAKALQFTPAKSTNLRESHLADSSPLASSDGAVAASSATAEQIPHPHVEEASASLPIDSTDSSDQVSIEQSIIHQYSPEEQVNFHGQWISGKIANLVNNNFDAEEEAAAYQWVKADCLQYIYDNPTPPLFDPKIEALIQTPEWQQAIEEAGAAMVPDIGKSIERGFAL